VSVRILNNGNTIRATGGDANRLLIAMASDEQLADWLREGHGSHEFRWAVQEAIDARAKIYQAGQAQERRVR
jgi:hypothetical protein